MADALATVTKFTLTPATEEDIATGGSFSYRSHAVTARLDGEVIGVGGIGYPEHGAPILWGRLTDAIRKRPVQLYKTTLAIIADARARGITTLVAAADPTVPAAERWLERLGFRARTVNGQKVFIWQDEANVGP